MNSKLKKLIYMALLTANALTIFMVEAQIPVPVPIPGVKLGLANIITVYSMFSLGSIPTLMILIARILLGAIFSGRVISLLYSLGGGLLCYSIMLVMRKFLTTRQIWICSVIGAIFHNIGQILVAMAVTGTVSIIAYFPILMVSGIISGFFTGHCAQILVTRLGGKFEFRI